MGIFDWIPTVTEVFEFVSCRLVDHDWIYLKDKSGRSFRYCSECKKKEYL